VFVSYSSRDAWIARIMAERIQAAGAETWLDQKDLHGGDEIREKIIAGIDRCQEAIVLVSQSSLSSRYVVFEIGVAQGQHKRVTPILNSVEVGVEALASFTGVKSIALNQFDDFLAQLRERMAEAE
jgi:hypothetical protein